MEGGGAAVDDVKKLAVVEGDASPEAVGGDGGDVESSKAAAGVRNTGVETSVIGSVAVGLVVVGSVVAAMADVDADESATGEGRPMRVHVASHALKLPPPSWCRRIWWRKLHRARP
jgi:hypothetical protein